MSHALANLDRLDDDSVAFEWLEVAMHLEPEAPEQFDGLHAGDSPADWPLSV